MQIGKHVSATHVFNLSEHTYRMRKLYSPVINANFELRHSLTPDSIEVVAGHWLQAAFTRAHLFHVHRMHITFHTQWQVHLWFVGIWVTVRMDEAAQPPVLRTKHRVQMLLGMLIEFIKL